MTPRGARHYATAEHAKSSALLQLGKQSFVVIQQSPLCPREFAWIAPMEFFMTRAAAAIQAGIAVVEIVQ